MDTKKRPDLSILEWEKYVDLANEFKLLLQAEETVAPGLWEESDKEYIKTCVEFLDKQPLTQNYVFLLKNEIHTYLQKERGKVLEKMEEFRKKYKKIEK